MKSKALSLTLPCIFVFALAAISCSSKSNPTSLAPPSGTMSAQIGGVSWQSNQTVIGALNGNGITITGSGTNTNGASGVITLTLERLDVGSVDLNDTSSGQYKITSGTPATYSTSPLYQGTATITSYDSIGRTMSGKFNFSAANQSGPGSLSVTSGVFTAISWPQP